MSEVKTVSLVVDFAEGIVTVAGGSVGVSVVEWVVGSVYSWIVGVGIIDGEEELCVMRSFCADIRVMILVFRSTNNRS